jgi:hypothetical protein
MAMEPFSRFIRSHQSRRECCSFDPIRDTYVRKTSRRDVEAHIVPVTGLVLLICHLVHTWREERRLIWSARASFTKYAFLIYRYLLPACLVFVFISQSGFSGLDLSDTVRLSS